MVQPLYDLYFVDVGSRYQLPPEKNLPNPSPQWKTGIEGMVVVHRDVSAEGRVPGVTPELPRAVGPDRIGGKERGEPGRHRRPTDRRQV